jgi:hypothetical protein
MVPAMANRYSYNTRSVQAVIMARIESPSSILHDYRRHAWNHPPKLAALGCSFGGDWTEQVPPIGQQRDPTPPNF